PTSRLPTIASIAANRWWENHIAGACPPKYNRFSRRREFRSGFFADLRADVRVPVLVWEEEVQSQPIVRLSAHVSYSYFHFTLADHVFEIACSMHPGPRRIPLTRRGWICSESPLPRCSLRCSACLSSSARRLPPRLTPPPFPAASPRSTGMRRGR